nr:lysosomal Pro-X carboxypeptidase-like [Maniola hyperantus]
MMNVFEYINRDLDLLTIREGKVRTRWIKQELDHFDSKETRKWKMRYFERLDYWKSNGPIYLLIGGESKASPNWTCTGIMRDLAKDTHGAMYVSEHRYYGESIPLKVISTDNFKFLSSKQAIADIAKLIKTLKSLPQYKMSKVVVIGDSYAGNLATWLKSLYPELVDVALASSAPLLAKKTFLNTLKKCTELFGPKFNEHRVDNGVEQSNNLYGGLHPNVTKVIFTNGEIDPWSTLSISEDISFDNPSVILPKASHCRDLFPRKDDTEEIKQAREYIKSVINKWIDSSE